jgi:DNA-binding HxlR family transcriptional regulator
MEAKMNSPRGFRRSACAIANTLDVVGDKWSLLVIRDMIHGKRTFGELLDSPEGIPTNILADRLKRLQDAGIIVSSAYQERPIRYSYALSDKGKATHPGHDDIERICRSRARRANPPRASNAC